MEMTIQSKLLRCAELFPLIIFYFSRTNTGSSECGKYWELKQRKRLGNQPSLCEDSPQPHYFSSSESIPSSMYIMQWIFIRLFVCSLIIHDDKWTTLNDSDIYTNKIPLKKF